jgi:hypothetical protein
MFAKRAARDARAMGICTPRVAASLLGLAALAVVPAAAQPVLEVRIDSVVQAPGSLRFLASEVGAVAPLIVVLRNVGNQDLRFGNTPVVLAPNRAPWSIIQPPLESGNELSPNGSTAFRVDFAPGVASPPAEATISIATNAAGSPFTLRLTGTVLAPVLEVRADNAVIASGTELALPPARLGEATPQVVVIRNTGNADLLFESPALVKAPTSDPGFELILPPLESGDKLSPNGSSAFLARFIPETETAEPLLAEISIPTNAAGSPYLLRFSSGVLFAALELIADGAPRSSGEEVLLAAAPGEDETLSVVLRNAGTESLVFDAAPELAGDTQGLFGFDTPAPAALAPGAEAELLVRFSPTSPLEEPVTVQLRISVQGAAGFVLELVGSTPPAGCGNGLREDGETCDGDDLGEAAACREPTDASFPGAGERDGVLRCRADCLSFDASGCREVCGNCADDDGDGLVDFEDPDCCGGIPAELVLRKVRIRPFGAESKLKLDAEAPFDLVGELAPSTRDVFLQLRGIGEEGGLCLRLPAAELAEKGRKLALAQRGTGGLGKLALRTKHGGALRFQAAGKRLPFATPEADEVSLAIALHEAGAPADAGRCAALRAPLRIDAKGARRFP